MQSDAIEALIDRAEAARTSGDLASGLEAAEQAWEQVAGGDEVRRRRAGLLLTHFRYRAGLLSPMIDVALEVLPLLREAGSTPELFELLRQVALCACDVSRFDVAMSTAHEAYRLALQSGDAAWIALATNLLGCFFERSGDPWQAERLLREAIAMARGLEEGYPLFSALNNLGGVLIGKFYLLRDVVSLDEAREPLHDALPHVQEAIELSRHTGEAFHRVFSLGNLGEILLHLGQLGPARRALDDSLALARLGGFLAQAWRIGCSRGELLLLEGRPEEALENLEAVLQASAGAEQRITHLRLHHALWRAAQATGRTEGALAHLQTYMQMERLRSVVQLRAQSDLFVTRMEAEHMRLEALSQRARARELEADVHRDQLTGLGNRREMERRWPELLRQVREAELPLSVAMLDLDHFKRVNDTHGHATGDRVLIELAGLLRAHTRSADLVVRLGGEEFLLALPETAAERAFEVCDRLRHRVALHDWHSVAPGLRVTLSVGLAHAPPYDAEALTLRADAALYRAKAAGRNCLVQG